MTYYLIFKAVAVIHWGQKVATVMIPVPVLAKQIFKTKNVMLVLQKDTTTLFVKNVTVTRMV